MQKITQFLFDRAQYQLTDSEGHTVLLKMNYAGNSYEIEGGESRVAERVAESLLAKKHAVDFSYKFTEYEVE